MPDLRQQLPAESPNDIIKAKLLLQSLSDLGMVGAVDVVKKQLTKRETKLKEKSIGCLSESDHGDRSQ